MASSYGAQTPEECEVLQEEAPDPVFEARPIAVSVEGNVRTQNLPARSGGFRSFVLTAGVAQRVLDHDPKRKRAVLIASDTSATCTGYILGSTQAEGASAISAVIPLQEGGSSTFKTAVSPTLELTSGEEVWASAQAGSCILTVINEHWAL